MKISYCIRARKCYKQDNQMEQLKHAVVAGVP